MNSQCFEHLYPSNQTPLHSQCFKRSIAQAHGNVRRQQSNISSEGESQGGGARANMLLCKQEDHALVSEIWQCAKIVYSSQFVRVILAQGPC